MTGGLQRQYRGRAKELVGAQTEVRAPDLPLRFPGPRLRARNETLPRTNPRGPRNLGGIGESRRHQRRAVGDVPGELAGIQAVCLISRKEQSARNLAVGKVPGGRSRRVDPVVRSEEPEPILEQETAEVRPEVRAPGRRQTHTGWTSLPRDDLRRSRALRSRSKGSHLHGTGFRRTS